jgi:hypothetical protein
MSKVSFSTVAGVLAVAATGVLAQSPPAPTAAPAAAPPAVNAAGPQSTFPATPLVSKHFSYPSGVPYQVDTDANLIRGGQSGYNLCNSTTEGPESKCQTSFLNSLDDFCLWAPMDPNSIIANTEGEEVAWCTKPGRGTRLIPAGALQGVQFIKTPDYVQVAGFIDQSKINIQADDYGGELDPHGADLRGNPLGGLMYSTAFGNDNNSYTQVIEWSNFMGGGAFCFKVCDPAGANAAHYCEHIFDRIGCTYNMPNQAKNGTFESCKGESQDYPGVYTENGQVMTYTQPPEGVEPSPTYTPKMPASSDCQTFTSENLYAALATAAPSGSGSAGGSPSSSGSASNPSNSDGSAVTLRMSGAGILGVLLSTFFFA